MTLQFHKPPYANDGDRPTRAKAAGSVAILIGRGGPVAVSRIGTPTTSALHLFLVLAAPLPFALNLAVSVVVFLLEGPALATLIPIVAIGATARPTVVLVITVAPPARALVPVIVVAALVTAFTPAAMTALVLVGSALAAPAHPTRTR